DDVVPVLGGQVLQPVPAGDRGVVDQGGGDAEGGHDGVGGRHHGCLVADVALDGEGAEAVVPGQGGGQLGDGLGVAGPEGDVVAGPGQLGGDADADAAGGPGDDGHPGDTANPGYLGEPGGGCPGGRSAGRLVGRSHRHGRPSSAKSCMEPNDSSKGIPGQW